MATLRGYSSVLTEADPKVPKQSKVLKDMDKELLKLRKTNNKAYYKLILACHGNQKLKIKGKRLYSSDTQMTTQEMSTDSLI